MKKYFFMLLVISIIGSKVLAQGNIPQDFNTKNVNAIQAAEWNHSMAYLDYMVSAQNNFYTRNDPNAVLYNPSSVFSTIKNPAELSVNYVPVQEKFYQGNLAITYKPDEFASIIIYAAFEETRTGIVPLVPSYQTYNFYTHEPWTGTQAGPLDHFWRAGVSFPAFRDPAWSAAAGLDIVQSSPANGSWNGRVLVDGYGFGVHFGLTHNGKDQWGDGLAYGVNFSNIGIFNHYSIIRYSASDVHYMPGYLTLNGAYTMEATKEGNKFSISASIGKELSPTIPNQNDQSAVAKYQNMGTLQSLFHPNALFGGSIGARYAFILPGENEFFDLTGGYTASPYLNGPSFSVGYGARNMHLSAGYFFIGHANPGLSQVQISMILGFEEL